MDEKNEARSQRTIAHPTYSLRLRGERSVQTDRRALHHRCPEESLPALEAKRGRSKMMKFVLVLMMGLLINIIIGLNIAKVDS